MTRIKPIRKESVMNVNNKVRKMDRRKVKWEEEQEKEKKVDEQSKGEEN